MRLVLHGVWARVRFILRQCALLRSDMRAQITPTRRSEQSFHPAVLSHSLAPVGQRLLAQPATLAVTVAGSINLLFARSVLHMRTAHDDCDAIQRPGQSLLLHNSPTFHLDMPSHCTCSHLRRSSCFSSPPPPPRISGRAPPPFPPRHPPHPRSA